MSSTQTACMEKYHNTSKTNDNAVNYGVATAGPMKRPANQLTLRFSHKKSGRSLQNQLFFLGCAAKSWQGQVGCEFNPLSTVCTRLGKRSVWSAMSKAGVCLDLLVGPVYAENGPDAIRGITTLWGGGVAELGP